MQKIFSRISFVMLGFLFSSFLFLGFAFAETPMTSENKTSEPNISVFVRDNCTHCMEQKKFLEEKNISANLVDVYQNKEQFDAFTKAFGIASQTPITLAGDTIFVGYTDTQTGEKILEAAKNAVQVFSFAEALQNPEKIKMGTTGKTCADGEICAVESPLKKIEIPFLGSVNLEEGYRYTAAFILGFLDGFNPCAMWVLVVFILTLMQLGDRVKMAFVAGTFLIAEAVMYGFILVVWWKFFDFVGYDAIIKPIVGIVAIGGGLFFLYEGIFSDGTCKVTNADQRKKISQKISELAHSPLSWATFFGILLLAFSVNVIEFACSAGYPQVFTNILNSLAIGTWEKTGLLLTYLGAYMLDDLIIFGIALVSIEKLGITQKYSKYCNIFGGTLMLILGGIMIFKPSFLFLVF